MYYSHCKTVSRNQGIHPNRVGGIRKCKRPPRWWRSTKYSLAHRPSSFPKVSSLKVRTQWHSEESTRVTWRRTTSSTSAATSTTKGWWTPIRTPRAWWSAIICWQWHYWRPLALAAWPWNKLSIGGRRNPNPWGRPIVAQSNRSSLEKKCDTADTIHHS